MSEHKITLEWKRNTPDFNIKTYDRAHTIYFSGGSSIAMTAAPAYLGDPKITNPEEAFAASLSSCHMLTFLAMAAMKGFTVDRYQDEAVALLGKNAAGKMAVTKVSMKPQVTFSGEKQPDRAALEDLHHKAHENCFIANSVSCEVDIAIE